MACDVSGIGEINRQHTHDAEKKYEIKCARWKSLFPKIIISRWNCTLYLITCVLNVKTIRKGIKFEIKSVWAV